MKNKIHIKAFLILSLLLLVTDFVTKYFVRTKMKQGETIPVIEDFFHITYVQNRGAVFGLFQNTLYFFIPVTVIAVAVIAFLFIKRKIPNNYYAFSLFIILSGAIGNLIDRIFLGYVVDMIDFCGIWPYVFNIADCGVVVGIIIIALYEVVTLVTSKKEEIGNE